MKTSYQIVPAKIIVMTNEYFLRISFFSFRCKMLIFCATTLLAGISTYSVLLHKTITEASARKPIAELQQVALQLAADIEASQRRLHKLIGKVSEYQIQLARVPQEYESAATLAYLGALSDSMSLQIKRIKPIDANASKASGASRSSRFEAKRRSDAGPAAAQFLTQVFDLTLLGEYHQLLGFLQQLGRSSYVAVVEEMKVTGDQSSPVLKARLRLKFYFFNEEVTDEIQTATSEKNLNQQKARAIIQMSGQF